MTMSVLEAIKLVKDGKGAEHIGRFIGVVKYSALTGEQACFEFEDALVAAMALSQLSESAEGRRLLGLPKRKNTQIKAKDFHPGTVQSHIANRYRRGELGKKEAEDALATSLEQSPDLRTAARLLKDLAERNTCLENEFEAELEALGATSEDPGSRTAATFQIFRSIAGSGPEALKILRKKVEQLEVNPEKKRDTLTVIDELLSELNAKGSAE